MASENLPPEKVKELIDELIKTDDPAVVGLRRILKSKQQTQNTFPLKNHPLEEFGGAAGSQKVFTDDEKRVLELEREFLRYKDDAKRLSRKAEQDAAAAYERGLAEGKKAGMAEGEATARAEYEKKLAGIEEHLETVLANVLTSKRKLLTTAHRTLLDLSLLMAQKIVNTQITINPDVVLTVIKKCISHTAEREGFTVRVCPDDLDRVMEKKDLWLSISQRIETIRVEEDPRITPGGCIIESDSGAVDGRVEVQIAEMRDVIASAWESVMVGDSAGIEELETPQSFEDDNDRSADSDDTVSSSGV